jgi:hypothetical protein
MNMYLPALMAGLAMAATGVAAEKKASRGDEDMRRAIAFERSKDAAAARQARREAKRPTVSSNSSAERSVEEQPAGRAVPDPGERTRQRDPERRPDKDARGQ